MSQVGNCRRILQHYNDLHLPVITQHAENGVATETIYKEIDTFVAGQKLTGSFRMIGRVTNARDALYGFIQLERIVEATVFTLTTGNAQCNCYLTTDGAAHPIAANASAGLTGISPAVNTRFPAMMPWE